jgi:hypothetical protein
MSTATPEPAIRSYFFGKGYRDLLATILESWERNIASAQHEFGACGSLWPGDYPAKGLAILRGTAGVSVLVFGTLFFLAFSLLHVAALGLFFLLIYLGFSLVYLAERAYLAGKRFFTVCPECHSQRPLPEYFCSKCNAVHRRLIPSSYGILRHTCTCGQKLPATFFLKRGELQARCAECECLLSARHTESRKCFIPVFGGPAVGKSAYMMAAVAELVDEVAPALDLTPAFLDATTEGAFERARRGLDQGRPPDKTTVTLPRAFNLELRRDGLSPRLLYLYDPAGELFNSTEELVLQRYQEYLSGLLFLVDPFTLPAVQAEYHDRLPEVVGGLKPSALPAEDALARLVLGLEEHFGLGKTARLKKPVAVVITKVDAFDLEERIGAPALERRLRESATPLNPERARDELIREQLLAWEQGALVQQLEARCGRLRYFTCSALGRIPDGTNRPFEARGVMEPLLWILAAADPAFAGRPALKAA